MGPVVTLCCPEGHGPPALPLITDPLTGPLTRLVTVLQAPPEYVDPIAQLDAGSRCQTLDWQSNFKTLFDSCSTKIYVNGDVLVSLTKAQKHLRKPYYLKRSNHTSKDT